MAHGWFTCEDGSPDVGAIAATAAQVRQTDALACVLCGHGVANTRGAGIIASAACAR